MKNHQLDGSQIITIEQPYIGNPEMFALYHRVFSHEQGHILPPVIVVSGQKFHNFIPNTTVSIDGQELPVDDLELITRQAATPLLETVSCDTSKRALIARELRNKTEIYRRRTTGQLILSDPSNIDHRIRHIRETQQRFHRAKMEFATLYASGAPYLLFDGNHRSLAAELTGQPIHALEIETNYDLDVIREKVASGELFGFPHDEETLHELVESLYDAAVQEQPITVAFRAQKAQEKEEFPEYFRKK